MIKNPKVSQRSVLHECCKLQGHENNLIKFVCACHDCPYRQQKACAHCVIKLHGKHVEQMKEIDEFDGIINENLKKATQLVKESEQLFKLLDNPFKDFFDQLKQQLIEIVEDIQKRFLIQNQEKATQLIKNELDFIKQFNSSVCQEQKQWRFLSDQALQQYKCSLQFSVEKLQNSLSSKEIKQLLEYNLITLLEDFGKNTCVSYTSNTSRNTSHRHSSCHNMMTPRSALNVFNQNISIIRSRKIKN